MAATPARSLKLSADDWSALSALATRYGLPDRSAVVRRLISDAMASNADGMPSPGQIATLASRLAEAVRDPRFR